MSPRSMPSGTANWTVSWSSPISCATLTSVPLISRGALRAAMFQASRAPLTFLPILPLRFPPGAGRPDHSGQLERFPVALAIDKLTGRVYLSSRQLNQRIFPVSAFIISNRHIDAILTAAGVAPDLATKAGRTLLAANVASVNERYGEANPVPASQSHPFPDPVSPVQLVKLCNCFDYQPCEADSYAGSEA